LRDALLSIATVASVFIATQACTQDAKATKDEKLCTPGGYVFCRCADRSEGTKLCKDDGNSFDACTTDTQGTCGGGEIADPRTGQPIQTHSAADPSQIGKNDPPDAIQACPGKSTAVLADQELTLTGDTSTAINDRVARAGACAVGKDAHDHVYRLVPTGSGSLSVDIKGEGDFAPLLYVRTVCDDADSQTSCGPPVGDKTASLKLNVVTGRDYFLIVDGTSGSAGKYTATVKLTTKTFCGDGVVDANEACDDGNKVEGDGCSNDCQKVDGNPASGGSCPGQPVDVWPGRTVNGAGSTSTYASSWSTPDGSCISGSNDYPDHLYAVTPHASGTLVVTLSKQGTSALNNHMLLARRTCDDPNSTAADMCSNANGVGVGETMKFAVTDGQKVFVAVDGGGDTNNTGDYAISFKLQ
jgi:cysteine-rich repeat protein